MTKQLRRFHVQYLPTGRLEKNKDGSLVVLAGTTERGAKMQFSRKGGYYDWNLYALRAAE